MKDLDELDNLMDNFDVHSFWQKKKLVAILAIYLAQSAIVGVYLIKAVIDASDAGAVPKGMDLNTPGSSTIVR